MIGFDTNVLLRALLSDDPVQSPAAQRRLSELTSEQPGFISNGVLLELYWVFERRYRMPREAIAATFRALMEVAHLTFEDIATFARALHVYETKPADFSDALIAERNRTLGCSSTLTFDKPAAKHISGMELLA